MSSHWSASHSTDLINFNSETQCKGDGNSSKYINIQGFAGIGMKEAAHTKMGRLMEEKTIFLSSRLNWIDIDEAVTDRSERYSVEINESLPTILFNMDEIKYRGDGIFSSNSYSNNDDKIFTDFEAKRFSKTTIFLGEYKNEIIKADLTPAYVSEFLGRNYSTSFRLSSESDIYSRYRFQSANEFIEDDYKGSFTVFEQISKIHEFERSDEEDSGWEDCCVPRGDYLYNHADCIVFSCEPYPVGDQSQST